MNHSRPGPGSWLATSPWTWQYLSVSTFSSSLSHSGQAGDNAAQVPDQTSETSGGQREWEEKDKAAQRRYQETEGSNEPELHPVTGRATLFLHFSTSIQWVA